MQIFKSIRTWIILVAIAVVGGCVVHPVLLATWTKSPTASHVTNTIHIFTGTRQTSAWNIQDALNGTEVDVTQPLIAADALYVNTDALTSSFVATHYYDIDYDQTREAGVPVTTSTLTLSFRATSSGATSCVYVQTRTISSDTLIGSHGTTTTPLACSSSTTAYTSTSVTLSEITTSDQLNDLTIRILGRDSKNAGIRIDQASITASNSYGSFSVYPKAWNDQSDGTASTGTWPWSSTADAVYNTSTHTAPTAFSTSKYYKYTFDVGLPSSAVTNSAALTYSYHPVSAATMCVYYEVFSNTTLLGNFGTSSSPYSCSSSTSTFQVDNFSSTAIPTAYINTLVIKVYYRSSVAVAPVQSGITLATNWYLP